MSTYESPSTERLGTALPADVLTAVFDQAPAGIGICDENGLFVAVNDCLLQLFGQRREHVLGRPFLQFVVPEHRSASLAGYFESVVAAAAGTAPSTGRHSELRCIGADGRTLLISVTWTITRPVGPGHQYGVIHLRDITASKQMQRDLAAAHTRIDLAFQAAPIGLAVVERSGRLAETNPALQRLLGHDAAALARMTFLDITHPADRPDALATFDELISGPHAQSRETLRRYLHSDGHTVHARRIATAAHGADGRTAYVLLQIEDVTSQRRNDPGAERPDPRADRDAVTGLVTRATLARHIALSSSPYTLVSIGIDDLDLAADRSGPAGDDVVAEVAVRLQQECREGDVVARVGAAAFAILIPELGADTGPAMAQRIAAALAAPLVVADARITVAARIGVSTSTSETTAVPTPDSGSTSAADRHRVRDTARDLALQSDLHEDLRAGRLTMVYQPVVRLKDGATRSVEALARWDHPALGAISPSEFIPLAERTPALIHLLTRWSLDRTCRDLAAARAAGGPFSDLAVAVNISAVCLARPDLVGDVIDSLARFAIPADHLILEITETALADADDMALTNAHTLAARGIRIAIDDFGAGYSSLARLARLPVTDLKLDASLTAPDLPARPQRALIAAAVQLAGALDITLTAEGIETHDQAELIRSLGCEQAQGYLYGRPGPLGPVDK